MCREEAGWGGVGGAWGGGYSGLALESLLFTLQWPPRPWSSRTLLGPFVIPGGAACVSVNPSPVDHVSKRPQSLLWPLQVLVLHQGAIIDMFLYLYCPSGGPEAPSVGSKEHNMSLENCTFSPLLTASPKVLIITWPFSVPEVAHRYHTVHREHWVSALCDIMKGCFSAQTFLRVDHLFFYIFLFYINFW